ncbi:hypothetical protein SAMN05444161_8034 [Rhizobiales bacterium GAS191]|nr:hypothetical protein SAMN05444161_8034 [Rhizobiales bacterium GAS191]
MTVIPIAQYLAQFGAEGGFGAKGLHHEDTPVLHSLDPKDAEELARKLEEATTQGREEGRAIAAAAFEADLADERAQLEGRIVSARQAWLAEEGERLGAALGVAVSQLQTEMADSVARILKPFLAFALREQMLVSLSETMKGLLTEEKAFLKVSGPEDLLDALRDRLGPGEASIAYEVAAGVEVSVIADHTVIESRLQAWVDRFNQAAD